MNKKILPEANAEVLNIIRNLDPMPAKERPVTFWFISDTEKQVYLLADYLMKKCWPLQYCGKTCNNKWLLIAEQTLAPAQDSLDNLCIYCESLAKEFNIEFDGWETQIPV